MCLLIFLGTTIGCFQGFALNEQEIDISDKLRVEIFENTLPLNKCITAVAVDTRGNVAVKSGSTQGKCSHIISVYSKDGTFQYGYEITLKYDRGFGTLFFDENDSLCYDMSYAANRYALIVFEPHSTQYSSYESYHRNGEPEYALGNLEYVLGKIKIFTPPQSPYSTAYCTENIYALKNTETGEVYVVYDYSDVCPVTVAEPGRRSTLFLIAIVMFMILIVVLKRHEANRNIYRCYFKC